MIGLGLGLNVRSSRLGGVLIPLILDQLSVAATAIYALRKLRAAYSGFCIRVRRSSDDTELNIGFVANVVDTAALLTFVGGGNGFVVTKYDQSGNGFNSTQSIAGKQPRIVNAGVLDIKNTKPTLSWDGNRVLQTGSVINHSALLTASSVVSTQGTIFNGGLFQIGAINGNGSILDANIWEGRGSTGNNGSTVSRTTSQLHVITARVENNLQRIERDGIAGVTQGTDIFNSATSQVLTIGGLDLNTGLNTVGEISELILFASILGDADRLALRTDQSDYYNILILDRLSASAVTIYSLRRMRGAYTGFCIRVRRSSDNTEQNIGFVNNVIDTVALLAFVGAGNGFVVTKYDQSVNGFNATQATAANQPRIVSAGVLDTRNGKPSVVALGNSVLASLSFAGGFSSFTGNAVGSFATTTQFRRLASIRSTLVNNDSGFVESCALIISLSGSRVGSFRAGLERGATPLTVNTLSTLSTVFDSSVNSFYSNGATGSPIASTGALGANLILSLLSDTSSSSSPLNTNGSISEFSFFGSALSTADRQLLEADQKSYYGTP